MELGIGLRGRKVTALVLFTACGGKPLALLALYFVAMLESVSVTPLQPGTGGISETIMAEPSLQSWIVYWMRCGWILQDLRLEWRSVEAL